MSRVRGQCLIEMTLDKCVQRLRKRISDESEQQRIQAIINATKMANNARENGGRLTIDRTPSFYTTRSIVNLSGLSVSDPPSNAAALHPGYQMDNSYHGQSLTRQSSRSKSMENTSQYIDQANYNDQRYSNDYEEDFLTLNVVAGDVPMSGSHVNYYNSRGHSRSNSLNQLHYLPTDIDSNDGIGSEDFKKNYSSGSLKEEAVIHKTTSMANYYYKKTLSEDRMADMF